METPPAPLDDCWKRIGFAGDRSCPELERLGHCHNCRVFITRSRELLERELPADHLERWTAAVAQPKAEAWTATESILVFRLGGELLALPTRSCVEVRPPGSIHAVPHQSDAVFLGLVTIRGEIQPCFSLAAVLGLEARQEGSGAWIALRERGDVWVFPVDSVVTVHRVDERSLSDPPATLGAAHVSFTRAIAAWGQERLDLIDPDLIVREIGRRLG